MLMLTTFLPLVYNNLPPIMRSHHLWTTVWVMSLFVFNYKLFYNKAIIYILVYGLFLYFATITVWSSIDNWNRKRLFWEFYEIAIGISVITYFLQAKDYIHLAKLTRWSILFLFITAIMSIVSSSIDPMYARNIVGISSVVSESEREAILSFKRYGGGNYATAVAFMCLFPVFYYYYKNIEISLISRKQLIIFSIIIFLALIGMQIFANILITIVFSIISFLGMKKIRQSIMVIILFFTIVLIIPRQLYINNLQTISKYFDKESDLYYKINDLAVFIETGAEIKESETGTGGRAERYPILMKTFVESPFFGCYFFSDNSGTGYKGEGAHLYWMNKLTITGIIGFIIFFLIPFSFIRDSLKYFNSTYNFYYLLASISILAIGLMKVIGGRETWYTFFIILPGFYYLPLLKKTK